MAMPRGLGYQGKKLWADVTAEFDLSLEPHKRRILEDACHTADLIDELQKDRAGTKTIARGSQGQPVIHPYIAELRAQRALLAQLMARLNFASIEED